MAKRRKRRTKKNFFRSQTLQPAVKTSFHWLLALALFPLVYAAGVEFVRLIPSIGAGGYKSWWLYGAGALAYVMVEKLLNRPMWLYVFGHELTHVVSGLLSGAKIHSFKVRSKGGEVRLSKSNAFVALSPYIVPFYLAVVLGLFILIRHWWDDPRLYLGFQFMVGFTLAFHVSLTKMAVHRHQPDLKVLGLFLSWVLIVLGNIVVVSVLFISLFESTPTLKEYGLTLFEETKFIWIKGIEWIRSHTA